MNQTTSTATRRLFLSDFDGTLTTCDTLLHFIRFACGWRRFLWGFGCYAPLLVLMKLRLYPNWKAKQRVFAHFFAGMELQEFNRLCTAFAQANQRLLRPSMVKKLNEALLRGDRVMVVSASICDWVRPFFGEGVSVVGTQVEVVDGRLTGRFATPNCYGAEKVRRVQEALAQADGHFNRAAWHITAYGDSRGDREMLAFADEGHRVGGALCLERFLRPFRIRREERWMACAALAFLVMLNVLTICRYHHVFSVPNADYWNLFVKWFSISGFDPITYYVVSDWEARYNVYRHPLLAFIMFVPYVVNQGLMWLTGINCVQFVVAVMVVGAAFYAFLFMYRIMREVVGLPRTEATLLTVMLYSFAFVMVSAMVPDHFILSMFMLLLTLYVAGKCLRSGKPLSAGQTVALFVLTAGISLNNGLKTFLAGLFVNGRAFFRWRYLIGAVLLPALLMWGFCRVEYRYFVLPHEQARHAAKKAQKEKSERERQLQLKAMQQSKPNPAATAATATTAVKNVKNVKNDNNVPNVKNDPPKKPALKATKKRDPRIGVPMGKGEFLRWTDKSTPRVQSVVENLFGESLQLHPDHLLKDEFRNRPIIVPYRWPLSYVVEALVVLLFVGGLWAGRRERFLWLVLSWFVLDMALHVGLGFGLNEVYIMTVHWAFIIPIAIGYMFKNLRDGYTRRIALRLTALLTAYLLIYNTVLIFQFMAGG